MAGKLLRNISPDKIENRDAEYYKQALDLSPGYSDSRNIASMKIQYKVGDAPDLQSDGGVVGAYTKKEEVINMINNYSILLTVVRR